MLDRRCEHCGAFVFASRRCADCGYKDLTGMGTPEAIIRTARPEAVAGMERTFYEIMGLPQANLGLDSTWHS